MWERVSVRLWESEWENECEVVGEREYGRESVWERVCVGEVVGERVC